MAPHHRRPITNRYLRATPLHFASPYIMSNQPSPPNRRRHQWPGYFPGDPRYAPTLKASPTEFQKLGNKDFLSNSVLDCLIQLCVPKPIESEVQFSPMIGSLSALEFITRSFDLRTENDKANRRDLMSGMLIPDIPIDKPQRLIMPIHSNSHFFVVCFDFCCDVSSTKPYFFKNIDVYDSLPNQSANVFRSHEIGRAHV